MSATKYHIKIAGGVIEITHEEARKAFIEIGKFLLGKEEEMQEIFEKEKVL